MTATQPGANGAAPAAPHERLARCALLRVSEPGDPDVARRVRDEGPVAVWRRLQSTHPHVDPERDLDVAAAAGARLVCPGDDEWPAGLAALDHLGPDLAAPLALWVCGQRPLRDVVDRSVAVVGSRSATNYGVHVAGDLGLHLAEAGWTVVSGAAYGIDGAAHRGCLVGRALTVAVLASGIDVPYPKGHTALLDRVATEGLVVSEAPPGSAPLRRRFLVRNRLVAALSVGTVVVEAGVRSGALSTARHARRLGRPVLAVPGPVTSGLSAGCHLVLRHWPEAVLVTSADEVLEAIGRIGRLAALPVAPVGPRDDLPDLMHRVLEAVPAWRPAPGPAIAEDCGERPDVVDLVLQPLLANGLVERLPDGFRLTALGRLPSNAAVARGGDATADPSGGGAPA